jgi:hypothetical protein
MARAGERAEAAVCMTAVCWKRWVVWPDLAEIRHYALERLWKRKNSG